MGDRKLGLFVLLGIGIGFSLIGFFVVRSASTTLLDMSSTLRAGEFTLTPESVHETAEIGDEKAGDGRSFYIVRVRLADQSSTRIFRFDPHYLLVRSLSGGKPVRSRRGQAALGAGSGQAVIEPTREMEDQLAFEGPSGMRRFSVRFNMLGGPGALFSSLIGRSPQVEVPVTPAHAAPST